jgi:hypothetical protein
VIWDFIIWTIKIVHIYLYLRSENIEKFIYLLKFNKRSYHFALTT